MRPVLIFGASRGVGLMLARKLRCMDVPVTAMLRPHSPGGDLDRISVHIVRGDAFSRADVAHAFERMPAVCDVVSTLGGSTSDRRSVDEDGNINVIDTAAARAGGRFVLVTSIGCGDMAPFRSDRAIAAFGAVVDAKTRAEEHLRRVIPSATIVRPGGLLPGPMTERAILTRDPQIHGFIAREDLADLIVRIRDDPATRGETFAAVDADRARSPDAIVPFLLEGPALRFARS